MKRLPKPGDKIRVFYPGDPEKYWPFDMEGMPPEDWKPKVAATSLQRVHSVNNRGMPRVFLSSGYGANEYWWVGDCWEWPDDTKASGLAHCDKCNLPNPQWEGSNYRCYSCRMEWK